MYGLEKEPKKEFAFDLEKQLHKDPAYGKKLLAEVEQKIAEVKQLLREGSNEKEFDHLGVLLHGYVALQKIIKKPIK